MSYPFVVCLSLSALFAINILASMAATLSWHCLSGHASRWPAAVLTRFLIAMRLFPATAALVVVLFLFVPSYVLYEPRPADEVLGVKLGVLASVSSIGIGIAVWRALASWRATRTLIAEWMNDAEAITIEGTSLVCYSVCHRFPIVALIGVFKPRVFLSQHVLETLGRQELLAALEHEAGHLAARDNLKRVLVGCCRDLLGIVPCGRSLDRAWKKAAEAAADEYAARRGAPAALDLASALVKVARMVPNGVTSVMPMSAFLISEDVGEISSRVRRLAQIAESGALAGENEFTLKALTWSWFHLLLIAATYAAFSPHILERLHARMELLFPFLT